MTYDPRTFFPRLRRDERGSTLIFAAVGVLAFVGMAGVVVDIGYVYHAKRTLQISTDAAALAGAIQLSSSGTAAITAANTYSAGSGGNNAVGDLTVTATPSTYKCTGTTGATCAANTASPNALKVTETTDVPLFFARAFGWNSASISTTAYALQAGGRAQPYDIMIILDTTQSMNSNDSACGSTRLNCALTGFRTLLQGFTPPTQQVGLMIFPGVASATAAAQEYDCSTSTPSGIVEYDASPVYQIVPLSSDYKTGSSLNTSSNLVKAARGGASGCTAGISAIGGAGTFYVDVVTAAKNYLTTNARSGSNKMIIFLGDGDAGAASNKVPTGSYNNQCWNAQLAAKSAEQAGITIVTIGYGAPSSGCSTDGNGGYTGTTYLHNNPCGTLSAMATVGTGTTQNPQWFYSDSSSGCHGSNTASNLSAIFGAIGTGVASGGARLIPSS